MDFISELDAIPSVEVYLVGGAVRDLGTNLFCHHQRSSRIQSKDYDLLVKGISLDDMEPVLAKYGKIKQVGKSFGIINLHPTGWTRVVDIATPRTEVSTGPGYKDFVITPDPDAPIKLDLARRDAAINAICLRLVSTDDLLEKEWDIFEFTERIYDPFNGVDDIKTRTWKAVGDPYKRFIEDPTRIMRALRQSAQHRLSLEEVTFSAIRDHTDLLTTLGAESAVRLTTELVKLLQGSDGERILRLMFTETDIPQMFGLDYSKEVVDLVVKSYQVAKREENNPVLNLATVLLPLGSEIESWARRWQLSAVENFDRRSTPTLIRMVELYPEVAELDLADETGCRRLIGRMRVKIGYPQPRLLFHLHSVVHYAKVQLMYEKHRDVISSAAELDIDGGTIVQLTGAKGKQIGFIKGVLFERVVRMEVLNRKKDLVASLTPSE